MKVLRFLLLLVLSALGSGAWGAPSHSLDDILKVLDSQPVNRAALDQAREVLARPLPSGDDSALVKAHREKSQAAGELGLISRQIEELRQAIALGGGSEPFRVWQQLGMAEFFGGNFRNAIAAREKVLAIAPDNKKGMRVGEHAGLADLYRRIGDFEQARRHVRDAEGVLVLLRRSPSWNDFQYNWQASVEDALGRTEFAAGHYAEAEARFRRAVELAEKDVEANLLRQARGIETPPQFQMENRLDFLYGWLSSALLKQGRLNEAEVISRRSAYRALQRSGQDSVHANIILQQLITVFAEQNRLATALQLADRVQANFERMGVPATAYFAVRNHSLRANLLSSLGRWQESLGEFEAVRAALAADPQLAETLGAPTLGRVRALLAVGQPGEALDDGAKLHRQLQGQLGAGAYETAEVLGYVGVAQAAAGREAEALRNLREAIAVLAPAAAEKNDRSGQRFQRLSYLVESYLRLLAKIRATPAEKAAGIDAAAEAFQVADILRGQAVQQAMAASALRAAAGTPELEALVREEQDVRQERDALYAILADLMSRPADQLLPGVVDQMRQRAAALNERDKVLDDTIRRRFPDYADLAAARPVPLAEVQKALRPGESLLSVYTGTDQAYVWAIPAKGSPAFAAVPLPRAEVEAMVARLRAALDPGDVDFERMPAFDGAVAHRLYKSLLGAVEPGWAGASHLIIAAGGPLGRLPFSVLPTELPATAKKSGAPLFSEYRDWPWLARKVAVSQLPAAASLVTLRRMKPGAPDRQPFMGFGDPQFKLARESATARSRALRSAALPRRAAREERAIDYGTIAALPDTREEILSLAKVLGADPERDVYLGPRASKAQVLAADLKHRRIVAFATHGLLAGDFPGVDQPALALANPGGGQHGLLTLDDILGLKLDADWVVLSACNTAGGEGQGAEAVSGLGRGFFYAGSRALLVTHWPVETVSAKQLVVGVFDALSREPGLTRSAALQRSMLKVMAGQSEDGFSYAHPLFWAPYALVGDGGI
ncbi:MAG: CHAT domain-containing protein [Actinomycetota bacterium]